MLRATPLTLGVEVDLRSQGSNVIVHHEPFLDGPLFTDWLDEYDHAGVIINVKEEGLEVAITALLEERGIIEYFFLDQSFPFLFKGIVAGNARSAVRVSDLESQSTAMSLAGEALWCWIDGFRRAPGDGVDIIELQRLGYSVCLASPELHGGEPSILIPPIRERLLEDNIDLDAVCTKRPDLWIAS